MKQFTSLLDAAEYAATLSAGWCFANTIETYDKDNLLVLAETSDAENPVDEDSFHVVSAGGSIGFCEDGEEIDWLFIADAEKDAVLPEACLETPQNNFCPQCGHRLTPGANFCDECGTKIN
ncbi:zinc ribbon domain-containing protein [Advenella sp. RU8]|uniref:zinc ribbon domain-containing protein n=1 Tax=Advenella sp. RU8 TaxID=3399575 RepID=UPI003AAB1E9F